MLEFASVAMLHITLMHIIRLCCKIHSNLCSGHKGHTKALAITNETAPGKHLMLIIVRNTLVRYGDTGASLYSAYAGTITIVIVAEYHNGDRLVLFHFFDIKMLVVHIRFIYVLRISVTI